MKTFIKAIKPLFFGVPNTIMIILSLVPLIFVTNPYIVTINGMTIHLEFIFFVYFLIKFVTQYSERSLHGVYLYFDIIALISFLPYFSIFRLLLLARLFSAAFRVKGLEILINVISENKFMFKSIVYICLIYMFVTSTIVFNIEPETFSNNYFYAFYWSGVTLTTVGYGDIYPITPLGQIISLISSFLGIGIIALPSAIISSNFVLKISQYEQKTKNKRTKIK